MTMAGAMVLDTSMMADVDRTAREDAGSGLLDVPTLELRQGVIDTVDPTTATCSVLIGGSEDPVPTVKYLSNYKPTAGDTCVILAYGTDLWALDRDGLFGSAAFSGYISDYIGTLQSRSSDTYGDLTTFGPQISIVVPASGSILFGMAGGLTKFNQAPGGNATMSHAASGANSWSAGTFVPLLAIGEAISASGVAPGASLGSTHIFSGLNPGLTTITAKYKGNTATCDFYNRHLWAIPL